MPKVLILRVCYADMVSLNGFKWPESGPVSCSDWDPAPRCGSGLHGWLWGQGDGSVADVKPESRWLVVAVDAETVVDLDGKVKFPAGNVVFCGKQKDATDYLRERLPAEYHGLGIVGETVTAGDFGKATAGDYGKATAGDYGTAAVGLEGIATAGDFGTATAGSEGVATAGDFGTATAGSEGVATAGSDGVATAGTYGTATAGKNGTATAGIGGTATAGAGGKVLVYYFCGERYRVAVGYVGEDGIEPNTPYKVENGKLVRA